MDCKIKSADSPGRTAWWFISAAAGLYLVGCASFSPAKPNTPFAGGPTPAEIAHIADKNPRLAEELGKLPEFQDGISAEEARHLSGFNGLYAGNRAAMDRIAGAVDEVGLPAYRKYCAPLQAFYWLVADGKKESIERLLAVFSLDGLLYAAWDFIPVYEREKSKDSGKLGHRRRVYFQRWADFDRVVDRLSAPELLHLYINQNIRYFKNTFNSHTPQHTFEKNWGDCDDLAVFGRYVLRRAGYHAVCRYAHWLPNNRGHVGVVVRQDDGRYFLAVDFGRSSNRMSGPYRTLAEVDDTLARGRDYYDSGWWHPPR